MTERAPLTLDARGLRCPWPALRLARAMRQGRIVRILADDPAAPGEIAALACEHGWALAGDGGTWTVTPPA